MKSSIACLLVLAAAQAQYFVHTNRQYGLGGYAEYHGGYYPYAGTVHTAAVPAAVPAAYPVAYGYPLCSANQYHAQDELGQASFGYAHPGHAATNVRDAYGNQVGSYAYFNPEGKEVCVPYTADSRGFRAKRQIMSYGATAFGYPYAGYNYGAAPFVYNFATPAVVAAPAVSTREATQTRTILTPGQAVAYCVD